MSDDGVRASRDEFVSVAQRQVEGKKPAELVIAPGPHIRPHGYEQDAG